MMCDISYKIENIIHVYEFYPTLCNCLLALIYLFITLYYYCGGEFNNESLQAIESSYLINPKFYQNFFTKIIFRFGVQFSEF